MIDALKQALEMPDLHFVPITDEQTRQAMVARGVPEDLAELFVQMSVFERDSEKVYGDLKMSRRPLERSSWLTLFVSLNRYMKT